MSAPSVDSWRALHAYWFAEIVPEPAYIEGRLPIWFFGSKEADEHIRQRFVPWLARMTPEVEAAWAATPRGLLSLILLFDQVPRNAFRGQREAYAHDLRGLELAQQLRAKRWDAELRAVESFFVSLPYQHQEDVPNQDISVSTILALSERCPEGHKRFFGIANDMARRHHEAIAKFGRFPHRNPIFGRTSTPEELAFLQDPKNNF